MNQFRKAQVVMLPTKDNPTSISIGNKSKIGEYHEFLLFKKEGIYNNHTFQHLYIISDDEIKEGDWIYESEYNTISIAKYNGNILSKRFKKIIATTDTSLILESEYESIDLGKQYKYYPLPQPSQQFIEKYIESYNKNEVITDILVEYEVIDLNVDYKWINTIKINPKDNTITIKKLKENWTREEVIDLLKQCYADPKAKYGINEWIEKNL